jgi:hypothetical protein
VYRVVAITFGRGAICFAQGYQALASPGCSHPRRAASRRTELPWEVALTLVPASLQALPSLRSSLPLRCVAATFVAAKFSAKFPCFMRLLSHHIVATAALTFVSPLNLAIALHASAPTLEVHLISSRSQPLKWHRNHTKPLAAC